MGKIEDKLKELDINIPTPLAPKGMDNFLVDRLSHVTP